MNMVFCSYECFDGYNKSYYWKWLVSNSGATNHVTDDFKNRIGTSYSEGKQIYIGNGAALNILHVGYSFFSPSSPSVVDSSTRNCTFLFYKNETFPWCNEKGLGLKKYKLHKREKKCQNINLKCLERERLEEALRRVVETIKPRKALVVEGPFVSFIQ